MAVRGRFMVTGKIYVGEIEGKDEVNLISTLSEFQQHNNNIWYYIKMNHLLRSTKTTSYNISKLPINLVNNILKQSSSSTSSSSSLIKEDGCKQQQKQRLNIISSTFNNHSFSNFNNYNRIIRAFNENDNNSLKRYNYSTLNNNNNNFDNNNNNNNNNHSTQQQQHYPPQQTLKQKYKQSTSNDITDGFEELSSKHVFRILETEYNNNQCEFLIAYLNAIKNSNQSIFLDIYEWVSKRQVKSMTEYNVQATIDTYYLLVSMYGQMGRFETASMIIRRVPHQLGHVDTLYASIFKSYIDHGQCDRAVKYFSKLLSRVRDLAKPEPLGVLVHGLLVNNMDRELDVLIERLKDTNLMALGTYNVILKQLSLLRSKEAYLDVYCKMIETIRPSFLTFKSLINVAIASEDVQGCKILEQQILGELAEFKVGLFRDIVKFYFQHRDFESLDDTIDYIFTAGHSVPNGVNHIFVHFEIEENQELVEYLIGKMSQYNTAFQSIHITKIIQLLLVTGNYQKALKWLELRESHFGIHLDSFAILPFYYFHKLRGEYDLCNYWRAKANEKGIDLDVPQMFETYFRLNLNRDGSFIDWNKHTEGETFEEIYERVNKPEHLYLKNHKHSVLDRQFASKIQENSDVPHVNVSIESIAFYKEPRKHNSNHFKQTEEFILQETTAAAAATASQQNNKSGNINNNNNNSNNNNNNNSLFDISNVGSATNSSEFSTTDIGTQTLVHVDFASRITYLLNESQKEVALAETDQRDDGGQFVGEFVYVTLINYLLKEQDEPNVRKYYKRMLDKQFNPPSSLTLKVFKLNEQLGTLDEFLASFSNDLRKSYIEEKYMSFLLSHDFARGLRRLQESGREELLFFNQDYKNSLTLGYLKNGSITMAEATIQTIIRSKYNLQPMVISEYINEANKSLDQTTSLQPINPTTPISINHYLQSRFITPPPELDALIKKLKIQ
ncbi:hypothetical protein PPL_02605 [Heterostelium album PN500]|uniref:Pentatricopeptide repeat-containing protein n=1 Tax=Heterostelium pallidum (strain ATCC 26659 / Pp 5 / PN500) TaxID=670386 RepID=D3B2J2_HETP5|nr:hypothetical protein PPL_02605 [Heterostelium album PN500]EFA83540.1 hypothetical protein PPL_02605 [Heterostelium album PN500]|eukprot:XP_020435657.1 hypothetical protein PPL_02605 [Heterostelium album PN500]